MQSTVRITKKTQEEYERKLKSSGEDGLYHYILGNGINNKIQYDYPEILILDRAEAFFALYRRTGKEDYFTIARVLRKAAHRLYRQLHRMNEDHPVNARFLNMVKKS